MERGRDVYKGQYEHEPQNTQLINDNNNDDMCGQLHEHEPQNTQLINDNNNDDMCGQLHAFQNSNTHYYPDSLVIATEHQD